MMTIDEREAVTAICLLAAFADGHQDDAERERIARMAGDLGAGELWPTTQRVLLGKTDVRTEAARLTTPSARTLAYEMAVCVCDAAGAPGPAERDFLAALRAALAMPDAAASSIDRAAGALVDAAASPAGVATGTAAPDMDGMVVNYAVLAGALELLPQSMATLAIIPLQTKMVYRIGAGHGVALDARQAKELLAAVGIGLTGQMLEGFARKLLGGLVKRAGGKSAGRVASGAAGPAVTFAATWALGQVATAYYAGGRSLSAPRLQELFAAKRGEASALHERYRGQIEARAGSLDVAQLASLIRAQ